MFKPIDYEYVYEYWGRGYRVGNTVYPGVSTILGRTKSVGARIALSKWKNNLGDDYSALREGAIARGVNWHKYLETRYWERNLDSANRILEDSPELVAISKVSKNVLEALDRVKLLCCEHTVICREYGYAGTLDMLVESGGEIILLDWKTSSKLKTDKQWGDYYLQLAAYSQALREMYGLGINRASVVVFYSFSPPDIRKIDPTQIDEFFREFILRLEMFKSNSVENQLEQLDNLVLSKHTQ